MLAHVLWTIAGCLVVFAGGGYFVLLTIYALGYTNGVADMELRQEQQQRQRPSGKEPLRG